MDKSITSREYAIFLRELRSARKRAGISQAEVAERVGETQSFVSKCERGERRIDVVELRAFCAAINIPFAAFVRDLDAVLSAEAGRKRQTRSPE